MGPKFQRLMYDLDD